MGKNVFNLLVLQVPPLFVFFVPTGLGDHHLEVRKHMLNAALKAVNDHGKVCIQISVYLTFTMLYVSSVNLC